MERLEGGVDGDGGGELVLGVVEVVSVTEYQTNFC